MLPFIRPDLIKLDMRLLQGRTTVEASHIVNTVRAQAERTDAVVIAEGIETIKHAREAVAAGATIGQGPPGAAAVGHAAPGGGDPPAERPGDRRPGHPWEVVASAREPRRATRSRYEFLATRAAFTGALGHGMPVTPVAGSAAPTWPPTTRCAASGT